MPNTSPQQCMSCLHPSYSSSLLFFIPPVLHPSCSSSLLLFIPPVLHPSCSFSLLFFIPPSLIPISLSPSLLPVPMVIPQIIEHQASLPTDTTEDEGEYPSRPQVLPILPVPEQKMEIKAKKPGTAAPMVPKLTVDPPTHEVDPNHIWFEEQMMFDSDDDALIL